MNLNDTCAAIREAFGKSPIEGMSDLAWQDYAISALTGRPPSDELMSWALRPVTDAICRAYLERRKHLTTNTPIDNSRSTR